MESPAAQPIIRKTSQQRFEEHREARGDRWLHEADAFDIFKAYLANLCVALRHGAIVDENAALEEAQTAAAGLVAHAAIASQERDYPVLVMQIKRSVRLSENREVAESILTSIAEVLDSLGFPFTDAAVEKHKQLDEANAALLDNRLGISRRLALDS